MEKDHIKELNEKQREAVFEENKRICVVAGPGCGKTKTLVSKIIYLIKDKEVDPRKILVLTFAKKAIKEIKKRVTESIEGINARELDIYNFHSFCFRVLKNYSEYLGFESNKFPVYDRYEQEIVIKKILQESELSCEKKEVNSVISVINNLKNGKISEEILIKNPLMRNKYQVYEKYEKFLKLNKSLDFNDLLIYTIKLFQNFPKIAESFKEQFSNILIDEFQDINSIQ
jgi:DNA helicase-2/ATP-dependent DNA helicase PcrA